MPSTSLSLASLSFRLSLGVVLFAPFLIRKGRLRLRLLFLNPHWLLQVVLFNFQRVEMRFCDALLLTLHSFSEESVFAVAFALGGQPHVHNTAVCGSVEDWGVVGHFFGRGPRAEEEEWLLWLVLFEVFEHFQ